MGVTGYILNKKKRRRRWRRWRRRRRRRRRNGDGSTEFPKDKSIAIVEWEEERGMDRGRRRSGESLCLLHSSLHSSSH
jgi:hypothetical protein